MYTYPLSILFSRKTQGKFIFRSSFITFSILIILFEVIFSVFIYYFVQHSYRAQLKTQLVIETNRIESALKDIFSETFQVMTYIGKQISLYGHKDPLFIEKILVNSSKITSKTIYSWSLFDWIGPNNNVVVNSQVGLIQGSLTPLHDSYILKCHKLPWTLQVSHPTIGNTSGMWVIPAGVGITDQKNSYLGTLAVGFNVAELNNKLRRSLASKEISFIILDEDLRIILQSADNSIDPKSSYYRDILENNKLFKENNMHLENPISYKDIEYTYYKKIDDSPYIILIGFDKQIVQGMFWNLILPRLFELYGLGFFCLGLLYLLRRKMFNLAEMSGAAKKTFLQQVNTEMRESISSILTYSNIIIKYLTGETKIILTKERQIEFIEKIYKDALNIYTMTGNALTMGYIDIKNLIESSVDVQIEIALTKGVMIETFLEPSLLPFYGDELRLKQIITSLISLSMEYSPKGSNIKISATNETIKNKQTLLVIKIEDNGFSLTAEDMMRLSEKFSPNDEKETSTAGRLEFSAIEKLIKLHKGTYYIYNKGQKGKIIKITLPYRTDEQLEEIDVNINQPKNIYWLSDASQPKP